jgi:hypothetical protein
VTLRPDVNALTRSMHDLEADVHGRVIVSTKQGGRGQKLVYI